MAWNKPNSNTVDATSSSRSAGRGKMPRLRRGLLAGVIVVLGAGIAAGLLTSGEATSSSLQEKDRGLIKEATPSAAPTNAAPVKKVLTKEEKVQQEIDMLTKKYGDDMPPSIKTHIYYLKHPPKVKMAAKGPHDYFTHFSERAIAGTVFAKPGAEFVIQPVYDERFNQDFMNSLVDKIEIKDSDSDEVKENKRMMIETKKEIVEICRAEGKKPNEVLNEHAKTMYELGRYKALLREQLNEIRTNPDMSDDDVKDAFAAANKMLEQKGLPKVAVPKLTRRSLQLQRRLERKARKSDNP